jgi:hypothetical protein
LLSRDSSCSEEMKKEMKKEKQKEMKKRDEDIIA